MWLCASGEGRRGWRLARPSRPRPWLAVAVAETAVGQRDCMSPRGVRRGFVTSTCVVRHVCAEGVPVLHRTPDFCAPSSPNATLSRAFPITRPGAVEPYSLYTRVR